MSHPEDEQLGDNVRKKEDIIRYNDLNAFPHVMTTAGEPGWGVKSPPNISPYHADYSYAAIYTNILKQIH